MTSLASQLNQLRTAQRDEIQLPSRTKVSFLFDIKQAANIDDQTLFFMAQTALKQLPPEIAKFAAPGEILHDKSLEFYRGTQTRDALIPIDEKLAELLKLLAPHFMDANAHKVIEYLLRIYEIHIFHKEQLLRLSLPYFESAFFIKAMQCLNLKDDQIWGFLHEFAYQGKSIDRQTLVRCLGHNSGQAFLRYSDFVFSLVDSQVEATLHWKFFGAMLIDVLRADASNHTLMFNILPYISRSLRQTTSRDLRITGLFAIGQIVCRKSLSADYALAFFQQVLQTVADSSSNFQFDEDLKVKGMTVILLISQHQKHTLAQLAQKDLHDFLRVPRIGKLLSILSQQFDTSSLALLIVNSLTQGQEADQVLGSLLSDNLQACFTVTQSLIMQGVAKQDDGRIRQLLSIVKTLCKDMFTQSCIYCLKQLSDDPALKEKAFALLQEHVGTQGTQSKLITRFGDKEYTILSALGSNRQATRLNALQSINDLAESLTVNERHLVKMVLLQLVNQENNEEEGLLLMLNAIDILMKLEESHDNEFQCLETLLAFIQSQKVSYTAKVTDTVNAIIFKARVQKPENQQRQALITLLKSISGLTAQMPQGNKFSCFNPAHKSKKLDSIVQQMLQKPQLAIALLVSAFEHPSSYLDFTQLTALMQRLISDSKSDILQTAFIRDLYPPILRSFRGRLIPEAERVLLCILGGLPKMTSKTDQHTRKCISKLYGAAIHQKQRAQKHHLQFDFEKVMNKLQTDVICSNVNFAEFLVQTAMESGNELKKVFALMHLTNMHDQVAKGKGFCINFEIAVGALLVMVNDPSPLIRALAFKFAASYQAAFAKGQLYIEIFSTTDKPTSIVKSGDQKGKATPLLDTSAMSLITDLTKFAPELINDRGQLPQVLQKHKKPETFDKILKTLLDYPTFGLKSLLLEALQLNPNHTLAFAMNLSALLNKIFAQLEQAKLSDKQMAYLQNVGRLVSTTQSVANEMQQQMMVSLVFPFLRFCCDNEAKLHGKELCSIVMEMFLKNVLVQGNLKKLSEQDFLSLVRLYMDLQATVLKQQKNAFKQLFVEQAAEHELFSQAQLANALSEVSIKVKKDELPMEDLDFFLETLLQIAQKSDKLNSSALMLLETLVKSFVSGKSAEAYTIELAAQLAHQTKGKDQSKGIDRVAKLATNAFEFLKRAVKSELQRKGETKDPFEMFMKDTVEHDSDMAEETDSVLPSFQVFLCLFNALATLEASAQTLSETQSQLETVGKFLQRLTSMKNVNLSSVHKDLCVHLFHMYHSIVTKSARMHAYPAFTQSLHGYLETTVHLMASEFSFLVGQGAQTVSVVEATGIEGSAAACLGLISIASNDGDKSDHAIYLAFKVFTNCLQKQGSLQILESMLHVVSKIPITPESTAIIEAKTKLIFGDADHSNEEECSKWLLTVIHGPRKFVYLSVFLLHSWLEQDLVQLSKVAGSDQTSKAVQSQFLNTFLSSYVIKETLSSAMHIQDDKKVHKSLVRLCRLTDNLQMALNQMLSLHIHVGIVQRILTEHECSSLKTNSLQLLIDKIASFQQGFLANASAQIQAQLKSLIQTAISMLKANLVVSMDSDTCSLNQCLLVLLSRTACAKTFNDQVQQESLKVVQDYQRALQTDTGSLPLQTQLIVTEMTLFEVYSFNILEHLPTFFGHVIDGFNKVAQMPHDLFVETFKFSILKASVTIAQIFLKFLNVNQLETLITHVIMSADLAMDEKRRDTDLVAVVLDSISREAKTHPKLLVQACLNVYGKLLEVDSEIRLNSCFWRYLGQMLRPLLAALPKDFISEHSKKLLKFLKQTLALPYTVSKQGIKLLDENETLIVLCVQAFVVKLNEEQLRPFILNIIKWAMRTKDEEGFNVQKATMLCQVLTGVLHTLREFFVPLIGLYFEPVILDVLKYLGEALASAKQKRKRQHHQMSSFDQDSKPSEKLATRVLELVRFSFKYDTASFIQADTFEKLCDPVASMLSCTGITQFAQFVEECVKPTIMELDERINDDAMWIKLNLAIVMQTRNESWQTRLAALGIVETLFDVLRERYLIVLNDTIPFLSEALEDEHEQVEACAKRIVNRIEQLTGESINEYLK